MGAGGQSVLVEHDGKIVTLFLFFGKKNRRTCSAGSSESKTKGRQGPRLPTSNLGATLEVASPTASTLTPATRMRSSQSRDGNE